MDNHPPAHELLHADGQPAADTNIGLPGVLAFVAAVAVAVVAAGSEIRARLITDATPGTVPGRDGWILAALLLAPFCWCLRTSRPMPSSGTKTSTDSMPAANVSRRSQTPGIDTTWRGRTEPVWMTPLAAIIVAAVSLTCSWKTANVPLPEHSGRRFAQMLPTIHDEFSYLLQARTYLAGRWSWDPPDRASELFHTRHVLNGDRFASRYFPGTGAWVAPFLALGNARAGHWIAGSIVSVFVLFAGRQLGGLMAGLISGLLTAVSPGLAVFSNLILGHHPALVGLTGFLVAFLKLMKQPRFVTALLAGIGLSFAMLCRPMTAAAIGLPFGLWWVASIVRCRPDQTEFRRAVVATAGLAIPLLAGFTVQVIQNHAVTGSFLTTPYGQYTARYTPRHVYGFHNGMRGDLSVQKLQGREYHLIHRDYDQWASNLTGELAASNLEKRFVESLKWTLGSVPLTLAGVLFLLSPRLVDARLSLIALAIICLHLAHVPFWLDGILSFHYVMESIVLWLLIFGCVSAQLLARACRRGCCLFPVWWLGFVAISIAFNHCDTPDGDKSRVRRGAGMITFVADRYEHFRQALASQVTQKPALVLVHSSRDDLHVEYIRNQPPFDADLLTARYHPELYTTAELRGLFPERTLYLYDTRTRSLRMLASPEAEQ